MYLINLMVIIYINLMWKIKIFQCIIERIMNLNKIIQIICIYEIL